MHVSIPYSICQDLENVIIELSGISNKTNPVCFVSDVFVRVTVPGKIALIDLNHPVGFNYTSCFREGIYMIKLRKLETKHWTSVKFDGVSKNELLQRRSDACKRAEEFMHSSLEQKKSRRRHLNEENDSRILRMQELHIIEEQRIKSNLKSEAADKLRLFSGEYSEENFALSTSNVTEFPVRAQNMHI